MAPLAIPPTPPSIASPNRMVAGNDCIVPQPGGDGISSLTWSPVGGATTHLVSTNWDGGVRCWEVQESGGQVRATPKAMVNHENTPVLCSTFAPDGGTVFTGGCDKTVRMWSLGAPSASAQKLGTHEKPVKSIKFLPSMNLVVSGGWDNKLNFWDGRQANPVGSLDAGERIYDMDTKGNLLCVATADKKITTYDVAGGTGAPRLLSTMDSPLKIQSRCISVIPDLSGYVVGGIGGKAAIHFFKEPPAPKNGSFAYLCHGQRGKPKGEGFPVNVLCFHPHVQSVFCTAGSDGNIKFWDLSKRCKLGNKFQTVHQPIPCADFDSSGKLFAYASSYDWGKGHQSFSSQTPNEILIHFLPDNELKAKHLKKK